MSVATNIKRLREFSDMTQEELAEKLGVTRGAISQWESGYGKPKMGNVEKLAEFFHVSKLEIIEDINYAYIDFGDVSEDERELMENFRQCNQDGKDAILENAKSMRRIFGLKK